MEKRLNVEGMSCQHCVGRVKKTIAAAAGVSDVLVDLENKEAVFSCDASGADIPGIISAVNKLGFTATEKG
ncbi:MAG: heavy-metal-associated domain-containing protein [Desulfobacterales bacterium]|nr:heavy-metal-associated domain-containing protein [Desulfobacterales bacterium]